jgi:hypothetical protein
VPENLERKGWRLVTAEKVEKPSEADVSSYLLQPLRTLEQARRDCKRQQRRLAPAKAEINQPIPSKKRAS